MGLLDYLNNGSLSGFGGLLGGSYLPPQREAPQPQIQYDPLGNPIYLGQPDTQVFPDIPQPQRTTPAQMANVPAVYGFGSNGYSPQQMGTAMPQQVAAPAPPVAPQPAPQSPVTQVNDISVGGYQMPRFGSVEDFTPKAAPTDMSAQSRQPSPEQIPQQVNLPPALSDSSGGFSGAARGFAANAHNGPLGMLFGSIGGAMGMQSPEKQNLKAQYDALVPIVGPQKAMLAVTNPEAGKIILAQALEKKQYGFQKLDNDTVVRTDPMTGKVEAAYGNERGNTMTGPDGKVLTMPEGADPKTWRNEITRINADVAAGKKTEVQAKAEIFGNKMELANKSIADGIGTSLAGKIASGLPMGNYIQSPEYQKYKQAASNFITALLRQESGAAIGKQEFDRYDKEYMPQPGDSADVLAQKADARRVAIEGMKKGAGPGYRPPAEGTSGGNKTQTGVSWSIVK